MYMFICGIKDSLTDIRHRTQEHTAVSVYVSLCICDQSCHMFWLARNTVIAILSRSHLINIYANTKRYIYIFSYIYMYADMCIYQKYVKKKKCT